MLPRSQLSITIFVALIIILAAILLRFIHLDADTPSDLSWSAGLYVDEGYKTLSPRNLILFGNTHWHEADTYPGWMDGSPVTQWSIYAAFKNLGVDISSARIVPIIYFFLLTLLYIFFFRHRYKPALFYLGLFLITTNVTLFVFSRVALFEIPLSFFLYGMILPLTLYYEKKGTSLVPIIFLFLGGLITAYTIKLSSLVYFAPAIGAASIFFIFNNNRITKKHAQVFSAIFLVASLLLLALTHKHWGYRIDINPQFILYKIIENPLLITSPFILIGGLLCAGHIITYQSKLYFNNLYRLTLLFMVLSCPIILSLFPYSPLRYYVPFLPAYILLIIEWLSTARTEAETKQLNPATTTVGITIFTLAALYGFMAANLHEQIQVRYLIIVSFIIIMCAWFLRPQLFKNHNVKKAIIILTALSLLQSSYFIGSFIYKPTYHANEIRSKLREIVNDDEIIAGGWAPFFALGTNFRALYAGKAFNRPAALKTIKPEYLLLSNTPNSLDAFEILKKDKDFTIGKPISLGSYNETTVRLFPLTYENIQVTPQE